MEEHTSNVIVKENGAIVYGDYSTVIGDNCTIFGHHCTVWGKGCIIGGSAHHCKVFGDECEVNGEHTKIAAVGCALNRDTFDLCEGYGAYRYGHGPYRSNDDKGIQELQKGILWYEYSGNMLDLSESKAMLTEKAAGPPVEKSEARDKDSVVTADKCHVFGHHSNVWGKSCVIEKSAHHCKVFGEGCLVYGDHAKVCAKGVHLFATKFDLADHLRAVKGKGDGCYFTEDKANPANAQLRYSNFYLTSQESQALRDELAAGPKPKAHH